MMCYEDIQYIPGAKHKHFHPSAVAINYVAK